MNHFLEPRNAFGMTEEESKDILLLARASIRGYDLAVEVALMGYEMSFPQIDQFFAENGIGRK